jgi:hypothetical protein
MGNDSLPNESGCQGSSDLLMSSKMNKWYTFSRALTTFKLEEKVTSLSESSQEKVGDNREKLIAINRNILSRPRWSYPAQI